MKTGSVRQCCDTDVLGEAHSREGRSSVNSPRSLRCRRMQAGCLQVNDGTLCTARPQGGPETV